MRINKNKRAQEIFGLSFSVIFSIILIIFFIVVAFIVIRTFLNTQKCAQVGLFVKDFETEIDKAWQSDSYNSEFQSKLPTNLDYICFANLNNRLDDNPVSFSIEVFDKEDNLFFYPVEKACDIPNHILKHIDLDKITSLKNPYCINIENGVIKIQIEKGFSDKLVSLR